MSLTLLLIICSYYCKAQDYYHETIPTQFDKFVRKASIEWAAYANDSMRFTQPNLSAILVNRMEKGQIKTSASVGSGTPQANNIRYTTKEENKGRFYPLCALPMYDSMGNAIGEQNKFDEPPSRIDSLSRTLIYITQILFVEGGYLKSYIPWVSPAFSICTSGHYFIMFGDYFSTCLNFRYNLISPPQLLYLGETKRNLKLDSIQKSDKLKELYGKNLLETIWPYVLKGKFDIYSVETGKKINPKKIDDLILSNDSINRYVYDSFGNVKSEKYCDANPILFSITAVEVFQNWYYDNKNNLVFCKIPSMFLNVRRWKNGVQEKEATPVLKIVFN